MAFDYTDFKNDQGFLTLLNDYKVREYAVTISSYDFETEKKLGEVTGKVSGGSMSYSSSSPTRKTGSLTLILDSDTYDITSVNNLLAIDKKIGIDITIPNPFFNTDEYRKYGSSLSFNQGIFLITNMTNSITTTSMSISLTFIDKMGMLNGVCGGKIPSAAVLSEVLTIDADLNSTTSYPLISTIIRELVHHFGNENYSKIIIEDVPDTGRSVVSWAGSTPVRFAEDYSCFIITTTPTAEDINNYPNSANYGDDVGYLATDLTWPGEFAVAIGSTVTEALDTIVSTLGNYEYFYDIEGYFHFQAIRNFNTTGTAPTVVDNLDSSSVFNIGDGDAADLSFQDQYLMIYSEDEFLNEFSNTNLVTSVSFNPNYSNIKNDFVVWGTKAEDGYDTSVRFHLAIDSRPKYQEGISLCTKTIWCVRNKSTREILRYIATDKPEKVEVEVAPDIGVIGDDNYPQVNYRGTYSENTEYYYFPNALTTSEGTGDSVLYQGDYYVLAPQPTTDPVKGIAPWSYELDEDENETSTVIVSDYWIALSGDEYEVLLHSPSLNWFETPTEESETDADGNTTTYNVYPDGFDWREELYRLALMAYGTSTEGTYYDEEMLAEWRNIFNPCLKDLDPAVTVAESTSGGYTNPYWTTFKDDWQDHFGQPIDGAANPNPVPWKGYNIAIINSPQSIRYWLDIIDTSSNLGQYSVTRIGRRTVAEENSSINEVLNREVPDILFIDGTQDMEDIVAQRTEAISIGQAYLVMNSNNIYYLATRSSYGSCYEDVRSLFYNHLIYNSSVALTSIPVLYLDVNKVVRLNFPDLGIVGNYVINTMSFDFSTLATMSLSLNEAIVVI